MTARLRNAMMPVKGGQFGPVKATRYADLKYQFRIDHWRILDGGRGVGPQYGSDRELLADLPRFATQFGC